MQILFIVLNDLSYLEAIFEKFLEHKVRGATMIDSQGMAEAVMANEGLISLLSGPFSRSLGNGQKGSKTIFTVMNDSKKAQQVIEDIREIVSYSKKPVIGFMFTMPVSGIYPMKHKK